MPLATRELKITGYLLTETASATILVNGSEVYSGVLAPGSAGPMLPSEIVDLAILEYEGQTKQFETIHINITITSGAVALGIVNVNTSDDPSVSKWDYKHDAVVGNDGRIDILINGEPPAWPGNDGLRVPGGTPENPDWTGWTFILIKDDIMDFDYVSLSIIPEVPPTTP